MRRLKLSAGLLSPALFTLFLSLLSPATLAAQSIAGIVRDTSGGVLPGVTVEAASPSLIERVRTAVSDGTGQYRITDLTPGVYRVTFTLAGFSVVQRESVEVSGAGVTTINADMRVGALEETIIVTGETPVVDVQTSTRRIAVLDKSIVEVLPASRGYGNFLAAIPGIQATGLNSGVTPTTNFFTSRGGRGNEGTIQIDGMNVGSAFNGGGVAGFAYDPSSAEEIQITVAGGLGEVDRGGPAFNIIPKTGGNSFAGQYFGSTSGEWSQGDNLDDTLKSYGITEVPGIINNWDTSVSLGGPVFRDRLWFYGTARTYGTHQDVANAYGNLNMGNPNSWSYQRDDNLKQRSSNSKQIGAIRLTGQLTPKNKVGFYHDYNKACTGSALVQGGDQCRDRESNWIALGGSTTAPETGTVWDDREKIVQATWTSPATNRLLFEMGFSSFNSRWGGQTPAGALTNLVAVTEQNAAAGVPLPNYTYRGLATPFGNDQQHNVWRASASYVTGAHNMKVGYQAAYQVHYNFSALANANPLSYRFNNGVPNQFTMSIAPLTQSNRTRYDALYVQDQWTRGRLTLQGGLRYEHAWSWHPAGQNGVLQAGPYTGEFVFSRTEGVKGYHDITPRMGAAYDMFGNGKTSLKVNVSKYLQPANNEGTYTINSPATTYQRTTNRSWTDGNRNYAPDCDLMNPLAQNNAASGGDTCGAWSNLNFGNPFNTTRVNPDVLDGWGVRAYDWQFGVSLQQEILPRVSAEVSYNRRSWGNFFFTDNQAIGPEDFDTVTIAAPLHSQLPNGGGYPVTLLTRNTRTALGTTSNYFTFADEFGETTYYWHGVDVTVNARMRNGLVFQGGTSTGGGVQDICEIWAALPELVGGQQVNNCDVSEPWLTNFRGLASYTVPKVDVLVSAILRSQANVSPATTATAVATNGASLAANYNVPNAEFVRLLGRPLAGGVANQSVNLLRSSERYGERVNSVDMRFAKILRFGRTRTNLGFDLYNLFNANTGTTYNQAFGADGATWLRPTAILNPRFVRFNATVDF